MKYVVDVQGQRIEVTIDERGVRIGDREFDTHIADVDGTPVQRLTIGRNVHRVVAQRGATRGSYVLGVGGWRLAVDAVDERTRAIRDAAAQSAAAAGPAPLAAPMPGLIVRVLVEAGAEVQAGQPLVVMEAMKMENELRAASAGRVTAIHAKAGSAVEKGAVLVELA